jgi:hypothetical protein
MAAAHEKDQDYRSDERDGDGSETTEAVGKKGEHGCSDIALRGVRGWSFTPGWKNLFPASSSPKVKGTRHE